MMNSPRENLHACPWCGSSKYEVICITKDFTADSDESYRLAQCGECSVIFLQDRPVEERIMEHYAHEYGPYKEMHPLIERYLKLRTKAEIRRIKKLCPSAKSVLEIGCSFGSYLHYLKKFGDFEVVGIEPDEESCIRGRERFAVDIRQGTIDSVALDKKFDVIIMNHVIEHVYRPDDVFSKVARLLNPGGLFLIKTVNYDSYERKLFGKTWAPYEAPRHIMIFSPRQLIERGVKLGMKIEHVLLEKTPNNVISSIRNICLLKNNRSKLANFFSIRNIAVVALFYPFVYLLSSIFKSGRMFLVFKKTSDY